MPIYIIQAGDQNGPVKIGWSTDVPKRLKVLQSSHYEELRLIKTIEGDMYSEEYFQNNFSHLHIRGEWYRFHPSILDDVDLSPVRLEAASNFLDFRSWRKALGLSQLSVAKLFGRQLDFVQRFEYYGKVPDETVQRRMYDISRGIKV